MNKLVMCLALISGSAFAREIQMSSPQVVFGQPTNTTGKYEGGYMYWYVPAQSDEGALGTFTYIARPIPGKRYTTSVGISLNARAADLLLIPQLVQRSVNMAYTCLNVGRYVREDVLRAWVSDKLNQAAKYGGGTFEHQYGVLTARTGIQVNSSGSATIFAGFARSDQPGSSSWPNYCVVR